MGWWEDVGTYIFLITASIRNGIVIKMTNVICNSVVIIMKVWVAVRDNLFIPSICELLTVKNME